MKELADKAALIRGADTAAQRQARDYISSLAMPPGSLGRLEDAAVKLAGITGKVQNLISRKKIIVLCADNGVVAEGVSSAPQSVTVSQAVNMTKGLTGMSSMAEYFGDEVQVVDVGIASEYSCEKIDCRRIRRGTGDILHEPAMTREEAVRAVMTGIELAGEVAGAVRTGAGLAGEDVPDGVPAVGVGEMGIGNTTTSAAVLCALTGISPEEAVGRGGGINDEMLARKKEVVKLSLERSGMSGDGKAQTACRAQFVTEVLSEVGGLDIAAMCGVYLGCAIYRMPAVIDGYISIVAALCAAEIAPSVRDFLFASHKSAEPGYMAAAEELNVFPWMDLGMHLGEGSGCPLAFEGLCAACAFMNGMATFSGAGIRDDYLEEIRSCPRFQK